MDILIVLFGAISTYYLHNQTKICATKSSAILTLAAYGLSNFLTFNLGLFFGGTFIGMSAKEKINIWQVSVACLFYNLIFKFVVFEYPTLGGSLGFSAFVLVIFSFSVVAAFRQNRGPRI
jgi:hypothetical protein